MRRLVIAAVLLALAAACAHMAPPPGGPNRRTPPRLIGTFPDSLVPLPGFKGNAEFRFDEVIAEATPSFGRGTGDLERHVLLSPDTTVPHVEWHRDRITVRPRNGWRPNTVYWIDLLPGIDDLHRNSSKIPYHITVVTGDSIPTRQLNGRVINWSSRTGASLALVTAYRISDSARYRALADSTGRFHLAPLPAGAYLVEALVDQNDDHKRTPKEPWDTVRVAATSDTTGEIWVFQRDSLPPKLQDVVRTDSTTLTITLTNPVDPTQRFTADSIRVVLLPDSATIGPRDGYAKSLYDSLFKPIVAPPPLKTAADSAKFKVDSIAAVSRKAVADAAAAANAGRRGATVHKEDPPLQKRPLLGNAIVVRTRGLIVPGSRYVVTVMGVRTAGGISGTVTGRMDPPKPPPVDTAKVNAKARADSLRARSDSLKPDSLRTDSAKSVRPDSTRRPRG
ncbi:MAG TPA: Ig-like domain-containing protein [Gemmatimonadales bacterium]|jgi:hypothetical protein